MTEATASAERAFEEWWNSDDVPPGHTADMVPREVPYAAFMSAWQNRTAQVTPLMEALDSCIVRLAEVNDTARTETVLAEASVVLTMAKREATP